MDSQKFEAGIQLPPTQEALTPQEQGYAEQPYSPDQAHEDQVPSTVQQELPQIELEESVEQVSLEPAPSAVQETAYLVTTPIQATMEARSGPVREEAVEQLAQVLTVQ